MLHLFVALQTLALNVRGRVARDEAGATAVEYGLMVALIAAAIMVTVAALGGQLNTLFDGVLTQIGGGAAPVD